MRVTFALFSISFPESLVRLIFIELTFIEFLLCSSHFSEHFMDMNFFERLKKNNISAHLALF